MASFGESLRRERELRGVSLQDIAASTKIGVRMLKAIEEDRLDKLPQGLFVRGFVREYARSLALDEQKVMTDLSFHMTPPGAEGFEGESRPEGPGSEGRGFDRRASDRSDDHGKARRLSSRLAARLVNGGLLAAVFGTVAALILSPEFAGRAPVPSGLVPSDAAGVEATSDAVGGAAAQLGQAALPAGPQAGSLGHGEEAASVLPQPLQLTLTATEDCWIGLDVGGDRVENRILKKGESFSISARQNASLAVGNAGGLLIAMDSGPARPLGNRGEVKRNIVLSPESIDALTTVSESVPAKPPIG